MGRDSHLILLLVACASALSTTPTPPEETNLFRVRKGEYVVIDDRWPLFEDYRFALRAYLCHENRTIVIYNDQPWNPENVTDRNASFDVSFPPTKPGWRRLRLRFLYQTELLGVYSVSYAAEASSPHRWPPYIGDYAFFPRTMIDITVRRLEGKASDVVECTVQDRIPYGTVKVIRDDEGVFSLEFTERMMLVRNRFGEATIAISSDLSRFTVVLPHGIGPASYRCIVFPYKCHEKEEYHGFRSGLFRVRSANVAVHFESTKEKDLWDVPRVWDIPVTNNVTRVCCETEMNYVDRFVWMRSDGCDRPGEVLFNESNVPYMGQWTRSAGDLVATYAVWRRDRRGGRYLFSMEVLRSCLRTVDPSRPLKAGRYDCLYTESVLSKETTFSNGVTITDALEIATSDPWVSGSSAWIECRLPSWRGGELSVRRLSDGAVVSHVRLTTSPEDTEATMLDGRSRLTTNGSVVSYRVLIEKLSVRKDVGYQCVLTDSCTTSLSKVKRVELVTPPVAYDPEFDNFNIVIYAVLVYVVAMVSFCRCAPIPIVTWVTGASR